MPFSHHRLFILTGVIWFAATVAGAADHTKDTLATVKENVEAKKALLVDVREKKEWDGGHIENAVLVSMSVLEDAQRLDESLKQIPKDQIIYTHCAVGVRSVRAARILKKHGYDVRPLKAGYADLLKAGFPDAKQK